MIVVANKLGGMKLMSVYTLKAGKILEPEQADKLFFGKHSLLGRILG